MTPENYKEFVGQPFDPMASATVLAQDGGTQLNVRGRRKIYMVVKVGEQWCVMDEQARILFGRKSIWDLVKEYSDGYTFFYVEIK